MSLKRREFLGGTAALTTAALMPTLAKASDSILLGSILDTSGNFDAYGKPMDQAMKLALAEINAGGGEVDIAGPGVNVLSSVPRPQLYDVKSGTSMACPHVSGVAALLFADNPDADWDEIHD